MPRYTEQPKACPIHSLLETLTRPWTLHILWALSINGPQRFGALREQVAGISARVLTERLRNLAEQGFVYRDYKPTIPPAVTYGLTKRMKDIERVLEDLERLAKKWQADGDDGSSAKERDRVEAPPSR